MRIAIEDPDQPELHALLHDGEAFSAALYPPESRHQSPLEALRAPNVRFHVARSDSGRALATGAIVLMGEWAEVKRMWVDASVRCRGVARAVLLALEETARAEGATVLRLETGVSSHAALALYERAGFTRCARFGAYPEDPLSVFLEKRIK